MAMAEKWKLQKVRRGMDCGNIGGEKMMDIKLDVGLDTNLGRVDNWLKD